MATQLRPVASTYPSPPPSPPDGRHPNGGAGGAPGTPRERYIAMITAGRRSSRIHFEFPRGAVQWAPAPNHLSNSYRVLSAVQLHVLRFCSYELLPSLRLDLLADFNGLSTSCTGIIAFSLPQKLYVLDAYVRHAVFAPCTPYIPAALGCAAASSSHVTQHGIRGHHLMRA